LNDGNRWAGTHGGNDYRHYLDHHTTPGLQTVVPRLHITIIAHNMFSRWQQSTSRRSGIKGFEVIYDSASL